MIIFEDVYKAIYDLPDMQGTSLRNTSLSYPLVRVVDGVMNVVFMGYSYGDVYPDLIFTYDTESGVARKFDLAEGLAYLGIGKFPVEGRFDVEAGEPDRIEEFFWLTVLSGEIDKEAYEHYVSTITTYLTYGEGPYYWAFVE